MNIFNTLSWRIGYTTLGALLLGSLLIALCNQLTLWSIAFFVLYFIWTVFLLVVNNLKRNLDPNGKE
jgi:membrane protein DedA with SNARE-associated domain